MGTELAYAHPRTVFQDSKRHPEMEYAWNSEGQRVYRENDRKSLFLYNPGTLLMRNDPLDCEDVRAEQMIR